MQCGGMHTLLYPPLSGSHEAASWAHYLVVRGRSMRAFADSCGAVARAVRMHPARECGAFVLDVGVSSTCAPHADQA